MPLIVLNPSNADHLNADGKSPFARALQLARHQLLSAAILVDEIDVLQEKNPGVLAEIRQAIDGAVTLNENNAIVIVATTNKPLQTLPSDLLQRSLSLIKFDYLSDSAHLRDFWLKHARRRD